MKNSLPNKQFVLRPFWLSASRYFVLTFFFAVVIFALLLGLFHEENSDISYIIAGISFVVIFIIAFLLRGKLLIRHQMQLLTNHEVFESKKIGKRISPKNNKLTIEKNNAILKNIEQKSKAANILYKFSEAHWEVFELCNNYLQFAENELLTVGAGSPRIAALRRGKQKIRKLHKQHLLAWAANESKNFTKQSKIETNLDAKIELGNKALKVLSTALQYYPDDKQLLESIVAIKEFTLSTKVSAWLEEAESAKFNQDNQNAIRLYRDALFLISRESVESEDKRMIIDKINLEIEKLLKL